MVVTATDETRAHYQRPEVREIITRYAMPGDGADGAWRALNGDFHEWYRYGTSKKTGTPLARLLNSEDYEYIITRYRTVYCTLNVFDKSMWLETRAPEEITSDNPMGTPAGTAAYTLGCDIDKGHGCDIEEPEVKRAVEAAAQFLVDDLKKNGVRDSVWVLFSGGGIYVHVHHEICRPSNGGDRREFFRMLTDCFNAYIGHLSKEFFKIYPEHTGRVKYDALNNAKRIFKCILSIHKSKPFAVTPLCRDNIKIDFVRACLPLAPDMIDEAGIWYSTFGPSEREPLLKLLDQFRMPEEEAEREKRSGERGAVTVLAEKIEREDFPPCIRHILDTANTGEGKTRFAGVLSAFLYQVGWSEDEAWDVVKAVSDRNGLDNADHIFDSCFGKISCPSCKTIQNDSAGYPRLGLKDLGACKPDEKCDRWPGDYGLIHFLSRMWPKRKTESRICLTFDAQPDIELKEVADIEYDKDDKIKDIRYSPTFAVNAVLKKMPLVMSEDSADVYRFDGQIYTPDGERAIDRALCNAAGDLNTYNKLMEVMRRIKNELLDHPVVFEPNPYLLGVKNGVADLLTGEVREYRPGDLMLDQIEVKYDPAAHCPAFLAFIESIAPNVSDRITLIDWFVANAIKEPLAYVLFLLGLGRNGKGIYEKVLKQFFGKAAFRDMPLSEVKKNNFAASGFFRKRGWIASETGKKKTVIDTDFMKLTSGNGSIDADRKNLNRIQFEPYFQTTVDTNTMPQIDDRSIGWEERFIKVDLPYVFVANPDPNNPLEKQRDPGLFDKLTNESELSGILNLLLFRSKAIGKSRTIHKRSGSEMFAEYATQSSSVASFLDMFCEYDGALSGLWTSSEEIYEAYCTWCKYKVGEVVDIRYFGRQLKKFCGGYEPKRGKTKDRKSTTEYKGLIFDSSKHKTAIEGLQQSMSQLCLNMSQSNLNEEEVKQSQQITMSQLSQSNPWIEILRKFGGNSSKEKSDSSIYRKESNFIETIETIETSTASEPEREEVNRDKTETLIETKPTIGPHPRKDAPTPTVLEKLRIIKPGGYITQIPSPEDPNKFVDHLFNCGDVAEFQHWNAVDLIEKGIAEPVEAGA